MLILSLDSAGSGCSVCVWQDGIVLAQKAEKMSRGQDSRLVPLVQDVMQAAGVSFANLDRIAVTRGPGSFTGLRIGLATARGLGLAANKPVVGIDRFALHAYAAAQTEMPLLVLLDSRRADLFGLLMLPTGEGAAQNEPELITAEGVEAYAGRCSGLVVTGDGFACLPDVLQTSLCYKPLDRDEAVLAACLAAEADIDAPAYRPQPLYLREPDVTIAQKERHV